MTLEQAKIIADSPWSYGEVDLIAARKRLEAVGKRAHTERSYERLMSRLECIDGHLEAIANGHEARKL